MKRKHIIVTRQSNSKKQKTKHTDDLNADEDTKSDYVPTEAYEELEKSIEYIQEYSNDFGLTNQHMKQIITNAFRSPIGTYHWF